MFLDLSSTQKKVSLARNQYNSPVKLWGNLKQNATKGFFAVMIFLDLHF